MRTSKLDLSCREFWENGGSEYFVLNVSFLKKTTSLQPQSFTLSLYNPTQSPKHQELKLQAFILAKGLKPFIFVLYRIIHIFAKISNEMYRDFKKGQFWHILQGDYAIFRSIKLNKYLLIISPGYKEPFLYVLFMRFYFLELQISTMQAVLLFMHAYAYN